MSTREADRISAAEETLSSTYGSCCRTTILTSSAALFDISQLLNTGLDKETLATCVGLIESGVNPEALAVCFCILAEYCTQLIDWQLTGCDPGIATRKCCREELSTRDKQSMRSLGFIRFAFGSIRLVSFSVYLGNATQVYK